MSAEEKCQAILQKLLEAANQGKEVRLREDMGGMTLEIHLGKSHTHCGVPDGDWESLVDQLYNSLHGGPGLSWHTEA